MSLTTIFGNAFEFEISAQIQGHFLLNLIKTVIFNERKDFMDNKMFHVAISMSEGAKYAILPGDPGRVEKIAALLENPEPVATNREFTSWAGTLCGERVLVVSTGIGGPSAAIAMEELYRTGVHTVIRVGTCGAMQPEVAAGDLVIATAAVRMEGTSKEYMPEEMPAVANFEVISSLIDAAKAQNLHAHAGVVQSKDSFYGQHSPDSMPVGEMLKEKWSAWKQCGVLASEMETAAIFSVAQVRKIRAGCVLCVLWNQERGEANTDKQTVFDTSAAIRTAVTAMKRLICDDRGKITNDR